MNNHFSQPESYEYLLLRLLRSILKPDLSGSLLPTFLVLSWSISPFIIIYRKECCVEINKKSIVQQSYLPSIPLSFLRFPPNIHPPHH